jgi:O-antigen/teichoic acid export membrane protein
MIPGRDGEDESPLAPRVTDATHTEHFSTDHLVQNLGKHAISSGFVTATAQGLQFVLSVAAAVTLARLLSPEEFGLVGMVLAVTSLLGLFTEAGLSTATVQRETITQEQVSNLFWINVALSWFIGILSMGLAPFIAWFYRDSRLVGIMLALSLTFFLTGSTVQHKALLIRQMRFTAIAIIDVASMLAGIVVGCCLALFGFTYWSLVGMQLCMPAAGLVLTWWTSGWRPALPRRHSGVAPLVRFGVHLTVSDLIGRAASNSDSILIGRFFGAEALGLYSRASVLLARPLEQLRAPVGSVLLPVLSLLQSDPERYRRVFIRAYDMLALITFPLTALLLVLSKPLVLFLLGPGWEGAVPLFAGFTLVALSLPMHFPASWLFMSQGRGRDLFQNNVVLSVLTVVFFFAGLPWGPLGVVMALAIGSLLVRLPILYHLAGRCGPVSAAHLWRSFLAYLPCWGGVYITTSLAYSMVEEATPLVQLLVCGPVGLLSAAAVVFALERPRQSALYAFRWVRTSLATQGNSM